MHHVEPRVFLIGQSWPNRNEMREWLDHIGASSYDMPQNTSPGDLLVSMSGRRCYMSFVPGLNRNVERVRTDMRDYIDNILKSGHGSVLEHAVYNFAIEGVSRVFTGEMNRHRAGMAISEGSMRFIRFDNIHYWVPASLHLKVGDDSEDLLRKKQRSQEVFERAFRQAEENYKELEAIWGDELSPESKFAAKKAITSMMRRIIPMGVATGGVWSGNLRALRHIFTMRCDPAAEEEILLVATLMLDKMREAEPNFFGDFEKGEDGYYRPKYRKV